MTAQRNVVIAVAAAGLLTLTMHPAAAAPPDSTETLARSTAVIPAAASGPQAAGNSCQRRITNDDIGVCCRKETSSGKYVYVRTSRRKCRGFYTRTVDMSLCPRRSRGTGGLICCEYDDTPGLGARIVGKKQVTGLMPRDRCVKKSGHRVLPPGHCAKRHTRRDRMIACRKRGTDWVWKDGRCRRASVRDKRD